MDFGRVHRAIAIRTEFTVAIGAYRVAPCALLTKVKAALEPLNKGTQFEGQLGLHLGKKLVGFQRDVTRANGERFTDIDAETLKAVISAKSGGNFRGVNTQLLKFFDPLANPEGKKVVLIAPEIPKRVINQIDNRVVVVKTFDELDNVLRGLN